MALEVFSGGFLTLLQDFGRYRLQGKGITQGGAADEHAYLWANKLLNNPYDAPQLEISFGGFRGRFLKNSMIALCGADLSATLNGQSIGLWQSHYVRAGDEIAFASPRSGSRVYLAIKQGFDVASQLSSVSTVVRESLGGLHQNGKKIAAKDLISYQSCEEEIHRFTPSEFIPHYKNKIQLRFIPNHSITGSDTVLIKKFIEQGYTVTSQMDRMGYRLEGEPLQQLSAGIISQGVSYGAIQLPKDGQPIVLMKDRQTMGGYPLLGCVAYLDLAILAQSMPGKEVSFLPVDIATLEKALLEYKQFFNLGM